MKNFLVMSLVVSSFSLFATEEGTVYPAMDKKTCESTYAKGGKFPTESKILYGGSTNLTACDELSHGWMRKIYSSQGSRNRDFNWMDHIQFACCEKEDSPGKGKCINEKVSKAKSCESIAYIINSYGRDWEDEAQTKATDNKATSQAPTATANATTNMAAMSTIKCATKGIETVDYDACVKFQNQLAIIDTVQQVGYATQELVYKDKIFDSQAKHSTDENTATGALKAQGESLKMQQDMYQQRVAVDATKLAYLYNIYEDMPKSSEVIGKCSNMKKDIDGLGTIPEAVCRGAATGGQGGFALTMNQAQLDAMKAKLITIATQAGSSAILANLLGKRAGDVDNAIAKIDAYKPVDPFTTTESEATSTFCKQNPGLAQCLTGGLEKTFDTISDNIITFGDSGTGTTYAGNGAVTTTPISDNGTTATSDSGVTPVGSIVDAAAQGGGLEKTKAATVTPGAAKGSGGGGGGGMGSGGGGGGGAAPATGNPGGVQAAVQGKTPTYGGGSGSISVMGGFGINKKQGDGKGEENPFGKLFGKDTPKNSGVVNFRDIASVGTKGDNLFDMISKRYTKVSADKRLLEYELAK